MAHDARFGLPLSLVEALRADPSPQAATLAGLLADDQSDSDADPAPALAHVGGWRALLAGAALAAGVAAQAHAAPPTLEGRWTMAPAQSSFREDVTGPAPDNASVIVTRDDGDGLAYEVVERRGGAEVAHGAYDLSFGGSGSTSSVDGARRRLKAEKDVRGDVVVRAPSVSGMRAVIHLRRTGPDTALLEHDLESASGSLTVERIALVRAAAAAEKPTDTGASRARQPTP